MPCARMMNIVFFFGEVVLYGDLFFYLMCHEQRLLRNDHCIRIGGKRIIDILLGDELTYTARNVVCMSAEVIVQRDAHTCLIALNCFYIFGYYPALLIITQESFSVCVGSELRAEGT